MEIDPVIDDEIIAAQKVEASKVRNMHWVMAAGAVAGMHIGFWGYYPSAAEQAAKAQTQTQQAQSLKQILPAFAAPNGMPQSLELPENIRVVFQDCQKSIASAATTPPARIVIVGGQFDAFNGNSNVKMAGCLSDKEQVLEKPSLTLPWGEMGVGLPAGALGGQLLWAFGGLLGIAYREHRRYRELDKLAEKLRCQGNPFKNARPS